ncbi:protein kinase [Ktedonobacter sp. SOSP1-52]|uniref:protein kinase domain-containing protein n=1 Tax=Ktedonobacter sp. SOSP1-52 TaxID=2778366 RepID=UPI001916B4AD|nr:protein kinase [Ktedonobacter sp. SOSP1-52]GHO68674.1 protein kinase [Ktedonobacter sp. SOSP1-52]
MQIEVLGERYRLQEAIGRGGMATIYRGRDLHMERDVAIKVLREVYSTDPKFVTRFQREAKAASSLQHPNIVQVYDYGQSDGNYFIVMELIEGTDLRRYLRSRGVLAVDRAIIIAHDVALGLGAAHRRQIVHRDVKPQNVLVGRDGSIKLTDFGIASVYKDINAERLTTTGMTLGTVQYYAPEQAQGEIVSPAADVYALGIVMYEMLTGRTPFDGDTPVAVAMQHIQDTPAPPSHFNPNIPPALEDVILRCLEKIPEMRYRDGSSLARALETLGQEEIGLAHGVTPGSVSTPPAGSSGYGAAVSSPRLGVSSPYGQISSPNQGVVAPAQGYPGDQMLIPGPATGDPMMVAEQGTVPYTATTGTGTTRPFQRDDLAYPYPGRPQNNSRAAGFVTALIVLAALLLLGFSFFLAAELGVVRIPGLTPAATSTPGPNMVTVPTFTNLTFDEAQQLAQQNHLQVKIIKGPQDGVVLHQSSQPGNKIAPNTVIGLEMQKKSTTHTVPSGLLNKPLDVVKKRLEEAGITDEQIAPRDAGPDATLPPNTVIRVDPPEGQTVTDGGTVNVYVANLGVNPTPSPAATATQQPTPTPTPTKAPTPTPTPTPPTPTPTSPPAATPTPKTTIGTPGTGSPMNSMESPPQLRSQSSRP